MAAEILVKVYADGTGDYTSFKAAWDANKQDLVSNDSYIQWEWSGDLRNTDSFADATGYTTDATRNLRIRAKAGEEATSIAGAGTVYGTNTYIIVLRGRHCVIDGIEIDGHTNVLFQSENTIVKNCLIHDGSSNLSVSAGATFENCITYNSSTNNIQNANCDRVTQINTLAYSGSISILYRGSGGVIGNSVGYNENSQGTGVFFDVTNALNDNNASDDGSAPGTTTYTVGQSDFKNYAVGDYDIDPSSPLFASGVGAVLTPAGGGTTVAINPIDQSQEIEQVTLTQHSSITIGGLTQAQSIEQVTLQASGTLSLNNLEQIQTIEQVNLTQAHIISVDSVVQNQELGQVSLSVAGTLSVNNLSQPQTLEQTILSVIASISINDITQAQEVEQAILTAFNGSTVSIASIDQTQNIDTITLSQLNVVSVDNLSQSQLLQAVNFNGVVVGYLQGVLTVISAYNGSIKLTNPLTGEIRIL